MQQRHPRTSNQSSYSPIHINRVCRTGMMMMVVVGGSGDGDDGDNDGGDGVKLSNDGQPVVIQADSYQQRLQDRDDDDDRMNG